MNYNPLCRRCSPYVRIGIYSELNNLLEISFGSLKKVKVLTSQISWLCLSGFLKLPLM